MLAIFAEEVPSASWNTATLQVSESLQYWIQAIAPKSLITNAIVHLPQLCWDRILHSKAGLYTGSIELCITLGET